MFDDVLWGNVVHAVGDNVYEIHITHQPSMNKGSYKLMERVRLVDSSVAFARTREGAAFDPFSQPLDIMRQSSGEVVGRNVLLRVLERNNDNLHCEVSLMV